MLFAKSCNLRQRALTASQLLQPAIHSDVAGSLSQTVSNGHFIADMPNYWLHTTGSYYFPGLYTAVLPMVPGIWAIVRLVRASRSNGAARAFEPALAG